MNHQRYPSIDPKEPHSVSLKVLRLSRPSLVTQHPLPAPLSDKATPISASLAYSSSSSATTNPDPFLLTPILNLPPSFGSAYVGETFSCTLCANHDTPEQPPPVGASGVLSSPTLPTPSLGRRKYTRDVRIEAEMKTPGASGAVQRLVLSGAPQPPADDDREGTGKEEEGVDLEPGQTLQRIVNFDLKEEGNHVLAVTVSYYEATETSGRTRTFRKLYQFICKGSLIVRTKVGVLPTTSTTTPDQGSVTKTGAEARKRKRRGRKWVMEAQLENCSEDVMQLERVGLELERGLRYRDCNWEVSGSRKPILHPGEVEQCCFVVEEKKGTVVPEDEAGEEEEEEEVVVEDEDGRIVFGVLGISWRSEMGNKGFLSTGKLGTRGGAR